MFYSVFDVAHWFVDKAQQDTDVVMNHMRLQKLLYFAWVWRLVSCEERLFHYNFKSWEYGPVHMDIWPLYKDYRNGMPLPTRSTSKPQFPDDLESFLDEVWAEYGHLSSFELSDLTHEDPVWDAEYKKEHSLSANDKEHMILDFYGKIKEKCEEEQDTKVFEKLSKLKYPDDYLSLEESKAFFDRLYQTYV